MNIVVSHALYADDHTSAALIIAAVFPSSVSSAYRTGRDEGCDQLLSYRKGDLAYQAADADINDAADQLIPPR
jgi:hypothetical protein